MAGISLRDLSNGVLFGTGTLLGVRMSSCGNRQEGLTTACVVSCVVSYVFTAVLYAHRWRLDVESGDMAVRRIYKVFIAYTQSIRHVFDKPRADDQWALLSAALRRILQGCLHSKHSPNICGHVRYPRWMNAAKKLPRPMRTANTTYQVCMCVCVHNVKRILYT